MARTIKVCFVCLGNICRSPTAEAVFRVQVEAAGLAARFEIDSAGTGGWHAGELADPRTRRTALGRGVEITHRARQLLRADLERFDHLLAMDAENLATVRGLARREQERAKVQLLRAFDPEARPGAEVLDPYHSGRFEEVFDLCERVCAGLLARLRADL